ncbi:MAG: 50S ribosomal protein L18 [Candidatus Nanohaloarchaea archaeon]|nr:50S ribosomal protein L18 [Candidatus Nanohaloarchaea archaeon]
MAEGPGYEVPLKRRREGRTDYGRRLEMLKSGDLRAVVRVSNSHTDIQLIGYGDGGDETVVSASSGDLTRFGWDRHTGNLPAAYLTGVLAGKQAQSEGVDRAVPDLGAEDRKDGSRHYAAVKGMQDAGLDVPADDDVLPTDERAEGGHIEDGGVRKAVEDVKKNIAEEYGEG